MKSKNILIFIFFSIFMTFKSDARIKTVVVDFVGVIGSEDGFDEDLKNFYGPVDTFNKLFMTGQIDQETAYTRMIKEMEERVGELDADVEKKLRKSFFDIGGTLKAIKMGVGLLGILLSLGYEVIILTNMPEEFWLNILKYKTKFGLTDQMYAIVSGINKCMKPEEEIYKLLQKLYYVKFDEAVLIDDKIENLKTGKKLGMNTIKWNMTSNNFEFKIVQKEGGMNKMSKEKEGAKDHPLLDELDPTLAKVFKEWLSRGGIEILD